MSEDDTFATLSRSPFPEVVRLVIDFNNSTKLTGDPYFEEICSMLSQHGWTMDRYNETWTKDHDEKYGEH
jgi:hypothetical protein